MYPNYNVSMVAWKISDSFTDDVWAGSTVDGIADSFMALRQRAIEETYTVETNKRNLFKPRIIPFICNVQNVIILSTDLPIFFNTIEKGRQRVYKILIRNEKN